jgi:hypothetical protein
MADERHRGSRDVTVTKPLGDNVTVDSDVDDGLTDDQRAWVAHSESLWRRAHEIAATHAGIDAGDVYHALRCLELSPTERLRQGLSRGRLRGKTDGR